MASDSHDRGLLDQMRASFRKNLGTYADVMMQARIAVVQNLHKQITETSDPEKLMDLNAKLSDLMLSEEDIQKIGGRLSTLAIAINEFLDQMEHATRKIVAIRQLTDPHYPHGPGHH